jgi:hypothetical protein
LNQHKIEVLEKFRNVEQLKVFLDAMELGIQTIREIQREAREPEELTEVEFQGAKPFPAPGPEGEVDVDTEELETEGGEGADGEWSMANEGEVLVGEGDEGEGEEAEVEETSDEGGGADEDREDETNETREGGDDAPNGVLTCQWEAHSETGAAVDHRTHPGAGLHAVPFPRPSRLSPKRRRGHRRAHRVGQVRHRRGHLFRSFRRHTPGCP